MTAIPVVPDLTKHNPGIVSYLSGDNFTNGSVRLLIDMLGRTELQVRILGVWSLAPLLTSSESLVGQEDIVTFCEGTDKFVVSGGNVVTSGGNVIASGGAV